MTLDAEGADDAEVTDVGVLRPLHAISGTMQTRKTDSAIRRACTYGRTPKMRATPPAAGVMLLIVCRSIVIALVPSSRGAERTTRLRSYGSPLTEWRSAYRKKRSQSGATFTGPTSAVSSAGSAMLACSTFTSWLGRSVSRRLIYFDRISRLALLTNSKVSKCRPVNHQNPRYTSV